MYDSSQVDDGGDGAQDQPPPDCVTSSGSYDPEKDACYSCGGTSDSGKLGYCWNSQYGCYPACANMQGFVSKVEEPGRPADCGAACTQFD